MNYWLEGMIFIVLYFFVVGFACYWVAVMGATLINDIGNFPTRAGALQKKAFIKLFFLELLAFLFFLIFYHIFN